MHTRLGICALLCVLGTGCSDDFHSVGFLDRVDTTLANNRTAIALGLGDTTRKNKICSLTGHKAIHRRRTDDADALFTHWPL